MENFRDLSSFKALFLRLSEYKRGIFQIITLQIVWGFMELIFPFLMQAIVDKGIQQQDYNFILLILMAQLMLFLGTTFTELFKSWFLRQIGLRLNKKIMDAYLKQLISKNVLFFNFNKESALLSLLNDMFKIGRFLTDHLLNFVNALFRLMLYGAILFIFNTSIGWIFVISVVLSISWDLIFLNQREKEDNLRFQAQTAIRSGFLESIGGISDIKTNNLEWERIRIWQASLDIFSWARLGLLRLSQYYRGGTLTIGQLRDIFIIFLSATYVIEGALTLGAMLAIQFILGQLSRQVYALMEFVEYYHDAKLSLGRLAKVTGTEEQEFIPPKTFQKRTIQEDIQVNSLNFSYKDVLCLNNVNVTIPYQAKVAIVGESGSGKSTLLKLLLKLLDPDSGTIKVGHSRLSTIENNVWRDNCSVALQEGYLFSGSLKYNISLKEKEENIDYVKLEKAIKISCLESVVGNLDEGWDTLIGKGGKALSKGQGQRVLLARAIYKDAKYLIMDEPTSALDLITSKQVLKNIFETFADRTVIFATHKIKMAEKMDLILLVDQGEVVECGTHQELMDLEGYYYKLFTS